MHSATMESAANLHRFYRIEIVRGLFDDWALGCHGLAASMISSGASGITGQGQFRD